MSSACILIVDDSREVVKHLSNELLPAFGYKTIQATNGHDGLEIMRQEKPALVMLDLNLPKMTGLDVLQAMTAEGIDIPVVLMTGYGSEKSAIEAFRLGIKDYLIKPFTVDEVLTTIERVLAETQHTADHQSLVNSLKRTEADLRRQLEDLRLVMHMGLRLMMLSSPYEVISQGIEITAQFCAAENCLIWLREKESPVLQAYSRHRSIRTPKLDASLSDSPVSRVYRSGRLLRDTAFSGRGTSLVPGVFARAYLLVPLRLQEQIIGVIGVTHETSPQAFGEGEEKMLQTLADYIAIAIDNAWHKKKQDGTLPAEELEALKSNFVMTVSHDLRAPLNSIVGFAATLQAMKRLDDEQALFLEYIIKSAERMMRMVNALLDLARIDAGLPEPREACDLPALVDNVIVDLQGKALPKNMNLQVIQENDFPPVWGNPHRLTQAISNLVDNALKFSPEGETIIIRLGRNGDVVYVNVEDNGPGIAPKDLPFIFDQFYQGANGTNPEGTGLGLALVRSIAEAHGGEVTVTSRPAAGSKFTINLPGRVALKQPH